MQQVEHMVSEKTILAALSHPFIVTLAGTFQGQFSPSVVGAGAVRTRARKVPDVLFPGCASPPLTPKLQPRCVDAHYLYMVLEYVVGGEFFTHLRNAQRLDNNNAKVGHSLARTRTHTVKVSCACALCMHTHAHVPSQLLVVTTVTEAVFGVSHKFHHTILKSAYWL